MTLQIFSGLYKGRRIKSPKSLKTRPTSGRLREALFNICREEIKQIKFLDLFAGSGAIGFEALSHGADLTTFVDNNRESIRCIYENIKILGVANYSQVIYGDVFDVIQKLGKEGKKYAIIYADPPYESIMKGSYYSQKLLGIIEEFIEKGCSILTPEGSIFLEEDVKAINELGLHKHLLLQSSRKMGRSMLLHYKRMF